MLLRPRNVVVLLALTMRCAAQTETSIADTGAIGDGTTLNTKAIQAAIDRMPAGGGAVVVPKGVFLTGAIFLKPGVNLQLAEGAVLQGSTNILDYPKMRTRIEGHFQKWIPALVNADRCDHLRISGSGTLDGNGRFFWNEFWAAHEKNPKVTNLDVERPRLVFIENSNDAQVSGIQFKNSGFWNLHLYRCTDVLVKNVRIDTPNGAPPKRSPSTDGTDIDSCQRVTVSGCVYADGDDCVCLKGTKGPFAMQDKESPPTEHIRVTGCTFNDGEGVVTLGSEACVVRDVVVENCQVNGRMPLVRIKVRPDTPQLYEDIHFRNITLNSKGAIFEFRPWTQFFDLHGQPPPKSIVRNVTVTNVKGSDGSFGVIQGNPGQTTISDITLSNIDVQLKSPKLKVVGVDNLKVENVKVNGTAWTQ